MNLARKTGIILSCNMQADQYESLDDEWDHQDHQDHRTSCEERLWETIK